MYLLKVIRISFLSKWVVSSGGHNRHLGWFSIFRAPSGVTGLAQRHRRSSKDKAQKKKHFDRITLTIFDLGKARTKFTNGFCINKPIFIIFTQKIHNNPQNTE